MENTAVQQRVLAIFLIVATVAASGIASQHAAAHRHVIDRAGVVHHATAQVDHISDRAEYSRAITSDDDACSMPSVTSLATAWSVPISTCVVVLAENREREPIALVITRSLYRTSPKTSPPRVRSSSLS